MFFGILNCKYFASFKHIVVIFWYSFIIQLQYVVFLDSHLLVEHRTFLECRFSVELAALFPNTTSVVSFLSLKFRDLLYGDAHTITALDILTHWDKIFRKSDDLLRAGVAVSIASEACLWFCNDLCRSCHYFAFDGHHYAFGLLHFARPRVV